MTSETNSIRRAVTVAAPREIAFRVFTEGIGRWWPLETHHIGKVTPVTAVLEPRVGGQWYEEAADGTRCPWGRVIAWEPPTRVAFTWQIDADWKFDPALHTEVEVRFIPEGPHRTRVELEHRLLERFGARAAEMIGIFGSPGGWPGLLEKFSARTQA